MSVEINGVRLSKGDIFKRTNFYGYEHKIVGLDGWGDPFARELAKIEDDNQDRVAAELVNRIKRTVCSKCPLGKSRECGQIKLEESGPIADIRIKRRRLVQDVLREDANCQQPEKTLVNHFMDLVNWLYPGRGV